MSRSGVPAMVLFVILGLSGRLDAQQPLRAQIPDAALLGRWGLERAWWAQATIDPTGDRVQSFTSDEQATFVQSDSGLVTAIDNATGRRRWAVQIGARTEVRFAPVTNEQHALIINGTIFYALNKKDGSLDWQFTIPSAPSTAPGIDDTQLYIGAINGNVYAFSMKIFDDLAQRKLVSKYSFRGLRWQYKTGARIASAPVSTGIVVNVPSNDGSLYGLDAADRHLHFQFETDSPVTAPVVQLGNQTYVATGDLKLYCLNAETGALKWERLTGYNVRQSPRAIGEHVFLMPEGGGLHCLASNDGRELWANSQASGFLAATPTVVYASSDREGVVILDRSTGRQIGAFPLRGFPIRIANDRTDRLYFATERGLILCIRERGREFPLFHRIPEKRPVLPEVAPDAKGKKASSGPKPAADKKSDDAAESGESTKESGDAASSADENAPQTPAASAKKPPAKPKSGSSESKNP